MRLRLRSQGPGDAAGSRPAPAVPQAGVELYWLPLGAGGWFVKLNGRIWEAIQARRERRRPSALYHTALVVHLPEGHVVVENCWPIPNADGPSRGVLVGRPGVQPLAGSLAGVPLRGPLLAGRDHRRRRPGGGQPPAPERRPGGDWSPARAGGFPAQPAAGPRRARDGQHVELQLGDRLAAGPQWPPDQADPASGRWAGPRLAGRPRGGAPLAGQGNHGLFRAWSGCYASTDQWCESVGSDALAGSGSARGQSGRH
jgi:hypothetical protein